MSPQDDDKARMRRDKAKEAISLALANRWEEATALNREIVEVFPRDMEAHNRLGKALSELGQYREAVSAFARALEISPANTIAKKNLQRLSHLQGQAPAPRRGHKVPPQLFIEERGKTATVALNKLSPSRAHLHVSPGDAVEIQATAAGMVVASPEGEYLGTMEARLGSRLTTLIRGGNRYAAGVTSVDGNSLVIMIKEVYRHPSQTGVVSFPAKQSSVGLRSGLGAPPVPIDLELEDSEEYLERSPIIDWDEDGEANIAAPPSEVGERSSIAGGDEEMEQGL